jgi:hypothetical protein
VYVEARVIGARPALGELDARVIASLAGALGAGVDVGQGTWRLSFPVPLRADETPSPRERIRCVAGGC